MALKLKSQLSLLPVVRSLRIATLARPGGCPARVTKLTTNGLQVQGDWVGRPLHVCRVRFWNSLLSIYGYITYTIDIRYLKLRGRHMTYFHCGPHTTSTINYEDILWTNIITLTDKDIDGCAYKRLTFPSYFPQQINFYHSNLTMAQLHQISCTKAVPLPPSVAKPWE